LTSPVEKNCQLVRQAVFHSASCTLWHTNASYSSKMKDLKNKIWRGLDDVNHLSCILIMNKEWTFVMSHILFFRSFILEL
jgi:hypothetical protein